MAEQIGTPIEDRSSRQLALEVLQEVNELRPDRLMVLRDGLFRPVGNRRRYLITSQEQ